MHLTESYRQTHKQTRAHFVNLSLDVHDDSGRKHTSAGIHKKKHIVTVKTANNNQRKWELGESFPRIVFVCTIVFVYHSPPSSSTPSHTYTCHCCYIQRRQATWKICLRCSCYSCEFFFLFFLRRRFPFQYSPLLSVYYFMVVVFRCGRCSGCFQRSLNVHP